MPSTTVMEEHEDIGVQTEVETESETESENEAEIVKKPTPEDHIMKLESELHKLKQHIYRKQILTESCSMNVCRIHVHTRAFDWCQPPNKNKTGSGTGTGFVMKDISDDPSRLYIITAHHVVSNAVQVRINFSKVFSQYIEAKIEGLNPVMDVAILSISRNAHEMLSSINGLVQGNSDTIRPLCEVTAMGFALGRPHMQTTAGVVSGRISNPSRLQVDVAVNPGNSGGPLLNDTCEVVGIVVSGISDAQGINYVAPINEICIMLKRMLQQPTKISGAPTASGAVLDMIPSINCAFTKSNKTMNTVSNEDDNQMGIFCASIHHKIEYPQSIDDAVLNLETNKSGIDEQEFENIKNVLSSVKITNEMTRVDWKKHLMKYFTSKKIEVILKCIKHNTLNKGDIVKQIIVNGETFEIDMQMNCKFNFWPDRLNFVSILDRLSIGDVVSFKVWRPNSCDAAEKCFKYFDIVLRENLSLYREMFPDTETVSYVSLCGAFIMPLCHNHIPLFKQENLSTLMRTPQNPHKSFLLITHILPESPFTESESIGAGDILVAINNIPVDSITSVNYVWNMFTNIDEDYTITLHMRDGSLSTATSHEIKKASEVIRKTYNSDEYLN